LSKELIFNGISNKIDIFSKSKATLYKGGFGTVGGITQTLCIAKVQLFF